MNEIIYCECGGVYRRSEYSITHFTSMQHMAYVTNKNNPMETDKEKGCCQCGKTFIGVNYWETHLASKKHVHYLEMKNAVKENGCYIIKRNGNEMKLTSVDEPMQTKKINSDKNNDKNNKNKTSKKNKNNKTKNEKPKNAKATKT